MSYKALYRKYRPKNFDEIKGQPNIIKILKNIIKNHKISHAYLFSGVRGTGKTSSARIFAATINEIPVDKINDFIDIIEIDAASNNGVAEVRKIINQVKFSTVKLKYKVYIIDEIHMLSKSAFNALLKTIEDPPKNVVFIFATTEPQKMPATILSRVQRFNFMRIKNSIIVEHLKAIMLKESITYEEEALTMIAQFATGSLRDALSMVDQISSFQKNTIKVNIIMDFFGITSTKNIVRIINDCYLRDIVKLITNVNDLIDKGIDLSILVQNIIGVLRDHIVYETTENKNLLNNVLREDLRKVKVNLHDAYDLLTVFNELNNKMRVSHNPKQEIDLTLLKICEKGKINYKEMKNNKKSDIQEILIEADKTIDKVSHTVEIALNKTQEISIANEVHNDATSMVERKKPNKKKTNKLSISQIIGLLVNSSSSQERTKTKTKLEKSKKYLRDPQFHKFASWFEGVVQVTSGENFILVAHPSKEICEMINKNRKSNDFLGFTNKIFNETKLVFAMMKKDYLEVQKTYKDLKKADALPKPKKLEKPVIKMKIKKTEDSSKKQILRNIFGEKFEE